MRRVRKMLAMAMSFILMVSGVPMKGMDVSAKTQWKEEKVTSIMYDVTVTGSEGDTSFTWEATVASWSSPTNEVGLQGDGDYRFGFGVNNEAGLINLGYIKTITDSPMTVTVHKITVNNTYELRYDYAPVLKAGSTWENGLANIWSGLADGTKICQSDKAYLAFDAVSSLIKLYVAEEVVDDSDEPESPSVEPTEEESETPSVEPTSEEPSTEAPSEEPTTEEASTEEASTEDSSQAVEYVTEQITSVKYDVTVAGSGDTESFSFEAQGASWTSKSTTVMLSGDGDYAFEIVFDYEKGLKNLGFVSEIAGSAMTITVNKITVNDTYELAYETAPVLQPGVAYANGLANIWAVQPQIKICGNESSYLALDQADGAIQLYTVVEKEEPSTEETEEDTTTDGKTSIDYVKAMGSGWNLGNSFDGFDGDLNVKDQGELAWGNPTVVKELIATVKDKGFDSIRIPLTFYRRYTVNENASAEEYKYVVDEAWLARYKEVVNWALEEDLYVMVNMHHDSWIWLEYWDGNKASEEYRMYTDIWKQFAAYMADMPNEVCFETINEPTFEDTGSMTAQKKLDEINLAAYEIIRGTKGNEERMIVMPTFLTNHEKCVPLYNLIKGLDDDNIIATVHYYSEWVYSANLGKTGFDEELWQNNGEPYTPRDGADYIMETIDKELISKGIGVVIGEYGLLGYDASVEGCMQKGEELKYYEYMNELARQYDVCLMFWDNGSGIDRKSGNYEWKQPVVGDMLEASMTERSSYATGLDTLYFTKEVSEDVQIPLTLNGNTFEGIEGITEGTDYTYDSTSAIVTLKKDYVNTMFATMNDYGTFAKLVMKFSAGADWNEYLVKYAAPEIGNAEGTKDGIAIPVDFNGSKVRRVTAYQLSGRVGPNSSWWEYLQHDSAFSTDYVAGNISLKNAFFADPTVQNGLTKLKVEFYDGQIAYVWVNIADDKVTSSPDLAVNADDISASEIICLYTGEAAIPAQYLKMPVGGSVYGTWIDDTTNNGMVTLTGWPSVITFDTKAHDNFVIGGIVLYYMDVEKYVDVSFGIKDAPSIEVMNLEAKSDKKLNVSNLSENAKVSYKSNDTAIATVAEDGTVTGVKAGAVEIIVTVEQYNRSDDFAVTVTVTESSREEVSGGQEAPKPSVNPSPSATPTTSNVVVIEEEKAPLTASVAEVNGAVQMIFSPADAVLKVSVLQKYYGRSMFVNTHLGNGIGFTVEADVVTADVNVGMEKEVVNNFAEGFHTLKVQPVVPGKLAMTLGMHINVGREYIGAKAYVFAWNALTNLYEVKTVTNVNEIGNIGFYTDELVNLMIMIEK